MPDPEIGRQAAHVLLDTLVAFGDADGSDDGWRANLALQRLSEVGAVQVVVSQPDGISTDEMDRLELLVAQGVAVELSDLLGGVSVLLKILIGRLAALWGAHEGTGMSEEELVFALRGLVDDAFAP